MLCRCCVELWCCVVVLCWLYCVVALKDRGEKINKFKKNKHLQSSRNFIQRKWKEDKEGVPSTIVEDVDATNWNFEAVFSDPLILQLSSREVVVKVFEDYNMKGKDRVKDGFESLLKCAQEGCSLEQFVIGWLYAWGVLVNKNEKECGCLVPPECGTRKHGCAI